jgi:hypothetical protein
MLDGFFVSVFSKFVLFDEFITLHLTSQPTEMGGENFCAKVVRRKWQVED